MLENIAEKFSRYYMHSDIFRIVKASTTQQCVPVTIEFNLFIPLFIMSDIPLEMSVYNHKDNERIEELMSQL